MHYSVRCEDHDKMKRAAEEKAKEDVPKEDNVIEEEHLEKNKDNAMDDAVMAEVEAKDPEEDEEKDCYM
jgi:hypothetical protein